MSLLLDALYKASKDKEKVNELALEPRPNETHPTIELQLELPEPSIVQPLEMDLSPMLVVPTKSHANEAIPFPSLELELEPRQQEIKKEEVAEPLLKLVEQPPRLPDTEHHLAEPAHEPQIQLPEVVQPIEQTANNTANALSSNDKVVLKVEFTEAVSVPIKHPPAVEEDVIPTHFQATADNVSKTDSVKAIKHPGKIAAILSRLKTDPKTSKAKTNTRVLALAGTALSLLIAIVSLYLSVGTDATHLTMPVANVQQTVAPESALPTLAEESANQIQSQEAPVMLPAPTLHAAGSKVQNNQVPNDNKSSRTNEVQTTALTKEPLAPPLVEKLKENTVKETGIVFRPSAGKRVEIAATIKPNHLEIAYTALVENRLEDAAQSYTKVLKSNPYERDALLGMAYIAHHRGRREEALELYQLVLRQDPANIVASAAVLTLDTRLDSSAATSRAKDLVDRQPDSVAALNTAANALVRDGMLAEAALLFARAQRLEPENPLHIYNHAVALDRMGQVGLAKEQYKKVLQIADRQLPMQVRPFSLESVRTRLKEIEKTADAIGEGSK